MPDISWLCRGTLLDEGMHTAVYPYFKLRNILKAEDARTAVLEETEPLEREFGRPLVEPFYRLVWTLNTGKEVCTSHTTVSKPDHKSPFEWARNYLGTGVTILPRNQTDQHNRRIAEEMVNELGRTLIESPFLARQNTTGWRVIIRPANINIGYEAVLTKPDGRIESGVCDYRGYGCDIIISGSASSRRKACERWNSCVCFIADTLQGGPAPPHDHFA